MLKDPAALGMATRVVIPCFLVQFSKVLDGPIDDAHARQFLGIFNEASFRVQAEGHTRLIFQVPLFTIFRKCWMKAQRFFKQGCPYHGLNVLHKELRAKGLRLLTR